MTIAVKMFTFTFVSIAAILTISCAGAVDENFGFRFDFDSCANENHDDQRPANVCLLFS